MAAFITTPSYTFTTQVNAGSATMAIPGPTDADPSATTMSVSITGLPANGLVTYDGTTRVHVGDVLSPTQLGTLQFAPGTDVFSNTSQLTYSVTDNDGNSGSGSVSIVVGSSASTPTVDSPTVNVTVNTGAALNIAPPSDSPFTAASLVVNAGDLPTNGIITLANGVPVHSGDALTLAQLAGLQFSPTHNAFNQNSTFTYTVTDPEGHNSTGTVALDIGASAGSPTVGSPTVSVAVNAAPVALNIAAPTDPGFDATTLTITAGGLPTNGAVTLANGAAVTSGASLTLSQLAGLKFIPTHNAFNQNSTFTYTVTDPAGNSSIGSVALDIGGGAGNPTVASPTVNVAVNAASVALNVAAPTDPSFDASSLTVTAGSLPNNGTVTLANGVAVNAGDALTLAQLAGLRFIPTHNAFNQDSTFAYTVTDLAGNASTGTVALDIGSGAGNPTVTSRTLNVAVNAPSVPLNIGASSDPSFDAASLTITAGSLPTNGIVTLADGTPVSTGDILTPAQLAALSFTPTQNAFRQNSAFTYTVTDPAGNASTGSIALNIGSGNGNPTVASSTLHVAVNSAPAALNVAAPTDPSFDASTLTILAGTLPGNGLITTAEGTTVSSGDALTLDQLAGLQFTPTPNAFNQSSRFTYTVTDLAGNAAVGTIALDISAAIGNPILDSHTAHVDMNAGPVGLNIAAPADPHFDPTTLSITIGSLPSNGVLALGDGTAVSLGQTLTTDQLAGLQFTPAAGAYQASTFTYTAIDPAGNQSTGTMSLVIDVEGSPMVDSPSLNLGINAGPTTLNIITPVDPNFDPSSLTIRAASLPANGTITLPDGTPVQVGALLTQAQLGSLVFDPTEDAFSQSSSFTYTVTDPAGNATLGVVSLAIGDAIGDPVVDSPSLEVGVNAPTTPINIALPTDPNFDAVGMVALLDALPTNGTLTLANGTAVAAGSALSLAQLTGLQFTPAENAFDQTSSFSYTVTDFAGNSSTGTVSLAIDPAVGDPSVDSPALNVGINVPVELGIGLSDPNFDAAGLHVSVGDLPTNGTIVLSTGAAVTSGQTLTAGQFGGLRFIPAENVFNQTSDFTYTVTNLAGNAASGDTSLAIGAAIGDPAVGSPLVQVPVNASAVPLGIPAPLDPNFDAAGLVITVGTLPTNGTVTLANGNVVNAGETLSINQLVGLTFTPTHNLFGQDSQLTYTVTDLAGNASTGTVSVNVADAIGNPVVDSHHLTATMNAPATPIGIIAPTDPNFDPASLSITVGNLPTDGTVSLSNGNAVTSGESLSISQLTTLRFQPVHEAFDQTSTLSYAVTDPAGNSSTATVSLAIGPSLDVDPVTGNSLPIIDPDVSGAIAVTNVAGDRSGGNAGTAYTGSVPYIEHQFVWNGTQSVAVRADVPNIFLQGGSGADALLVTSGHNVVDGGTGSNFLVGADGRGGGADTFYLDTRSTVPTWNTLVNFHAGDEVTIWGFQQGSSTNAWSGIAGAAGYQGATMNFQSAVSGSSVTASVTFAGVSQQDATTKFRMDTGSVDGNSFLHIVYTS